MIEDPFVINENYSNSTFMPQQWSTNFFGSTVKVQAKEGDKPL